MQRLETIGLSAAQRAFEAKDSGFATAIEPLGIELAFEPLFACFGSTYAGSLAHAVLELAFIALHEPVGFGYANWNGKRTVLAGRELAGAGGKDGRRSTPFPKDGWKLARWYKDPVRNRRWRHGQRIRHAIPTRSRSASSATPSHSRDPTRGATRCSRQ